MKTLFLPAAMLLAGAVAYAFGSFAPAPRDLTSVWPVMLEIDTQGRIVLAREDFDAVVEAYNRQLAEIRAFRLKGCR